MIHPHIFRAYDIRGIAHTPEPGNNPDLTPESIREIAKATGTYLKRRYGKHLALGYDCRLSTPELSAAFRAGLQEVGIETTVLGLVTTPMLYFAVAQLGFDGGVMITASHNPKEYNGVKIVGPKAHSICGEELQVILKMIQKQDYELTDEQLPEKTLELFPIYLENLKKIAHVERPLNIVVDAANGAASDFVRPLFEALGCHVTALFDTPDGTFPNHEANPEELANMQDLIRAVQEQKADLGLSFDGDGDRVGVVDEKGKHYSADLLLLQLARDLLKRHPGAKIVFDAKTSQVVINDIAAHGGVPLMAKTGHSFIEQKLREEGALLGGEISGHLFFAENYHGFDDAFLGAARLLELLSKSQVPFSELYKDVPVTACTPEFKSPCPDDKKFAIVQQIQKNLTQKYPCITLDGVRVNFDAQSWGAVRCSNTSPNLTLRFEAPNETRLKEIIKLMLEELEKYPEIDLWWSAPYKN
ncbi:phosphomannomutase/phosphoglucomutase [Candidatus Peregrinibacteria bacterium]|nr:MAG: phosphomannomutase/phosphoglucomutase [Candidatus Peregrinibacteria bacterium]